MVPTRSRSRAAPRRASSVSRCWPSWPRLAASCSSAKPPLPTKPQARDLMRRQGAAMIDSLVAAHGGMENWNKVVEMTFRGKDEWKTPMDTRAQPVAGRVGRRARTASACTRASGASRS